MTYEVSLSIPLNCSCNADLSRNVEYVSCGFKESAKWYLSSSYIFLKPGVALTLGSWPKGLMHTTLCPSSMSTCQHIGPYASRGQPSRPGKHLKLKLTLKSTLKGRVKRSLYPNYKKTYFFHLPRTAIQPSKQFCFHVLRDFEISTTEIAAAN